IWRPGTKVVDDVRLIGEGTRLSSGDWNEMELVMLIATGIHRHQKECAVWRPVHAADTLTKRAELARFTAGHRCGPGLVQPTDIRDEGDLRAIGRPRGAVGAASIEETGELQRRLGHAMWPTFRLGTTPCDVWGLGPGSWI